MSNIILSPNMSLPLPVVGQEVSPTWASDINAAFSQIDSHNHSQGQGVQIAVSGLNIATDLPLNSNNLIAVRSTRYTPQSVSLSSVYDLSCVYVSGVDLYYNDGSGNQIRITQSGSVTGASGTITGLPSGTASAAYAAGTFTFQSATSTSAALSCGPITIARQVASGKAVTLAVATTTPVSYTLTLPAAAPALNQVPISDNSGNLSWTNGSLVPLGAAIATFPNLKGAYNCTATTVADANGFVKCNGQTIADASSPMNGQVIPNLNNAQFILGSTTAGTTGGSFASHTHDVTVSGSVNLPSHSHYLTDSGSADISYDPATNIEYYRTTAGAFTSTQQKQNGGTASIAHSGNYNTGIALTGTTADITTSPVLVTDGTGETSSVTIVPPYISAVYIMRIK